MHTLNQCPKLHKNNIHKRDQLKILALLDQQKLQYFDQYVNNVLEKCILFMHIIVYIERAY